MEPATVTIQLVPADIRRFPKFVLTWRKRWKTRLLAILIGVIVGVAVMFPRHESARHPSTADDEEETSRPFDPWVPWSPFLVFAVLYVFLRWRATRPSTYQQASPGIFLPNTYTVHDEGFFCQNERGETLNYWKVVIRFAETGDYFFVMLAERYGHILPKRCFASLEASAIFANQVKAQLEKAAAAPPPVAGLIEPGKSDTAP